MKTVELLYGSEGMALQVPDSADVLTGEKIPPVSDPDKAVVEALAGPIGAAPLKELIAERRPGTVAITVSDITRPVPNREFLPAMLRVLNKAGVSDSQIVIIIGTGMHRPSTPVEREIILGIEALQRVEVVDHRADDPATLVKVSDNPPISVCRRFVEADFRIVTGFIEAHVIAGFSGGRKGVCPALVDLETVQRFHGFETLADPRPETGVMEGNPCHQIALRVAQIVGVDFLFNVAATGDRRIAGVYCGDLILAHEAGCRQVAVWTTAWIDGPYDLVVTNGGGYPLDQTFYQSIKGMCGCLSALGPDSTLLQVCHCGEGVGSENFHRLMVGWNNDWRGFLEHIEANRDVTEMEQWNFQAQCRALSQIGLDKLWFVTDGIPPDTQRRISVHPVLGNGNAHTRAQRAIDEFLAANGHARVAVIPDGPYTMVRQIEPCEGGSRPCKGPEPG